MPTDIDGLIEKSRQLKKAGGTGLQVSFALLFALGIFPSCRSEGSDGSKHEMADERSVESTGSCSVFFDVDPELRPNIEYRFILRSYLPDPWILVPMVTSPGRIDRVDTLHPDQYTFSAVGSGTSKIVVYAQEGPGGIFTGPVCEHEVVVID